MAFDTKIERAGRQQLETLLPAVLESEIEASLYKTQANWTASPDRIKMQKIDKVVSTGSNPLLSEFPVSMDKSIFGQIQSLVDGQLSDMNVFGSTV